MSLFRVRVIDLETTGSRPPAHGVCEIGWQDVVPGADGRWFVGEARGALLVDPGRPIPPVTMAVHHITDEDVEGAPSWREAAPGVLRPDGGVAALAAHRAAFEQRFCTAERVGSVLGSARSGFGPARLPSPTKCCATGAGRKGWCARSACPPTAPCRTPT